MLNSWTELTLQAGESHPARGTVALPMDRVTGGPIETGTNLTAVKPVGEGWASCKGRGAVRDVARDYSRRCQGAERSCQRLGATAQQGSHKGMDTWGLMGRAVPSVECQEGVPRGVPHTKNPCS